MSNIVTIARWKDLATWTRGYVADHNDNGWRKLQIGSFATAIVVPAVRPMKSESVSFAGVRWYGQGLFVRETRLGVEVAGRAGFLRPGALVYNRLFAWKCAFALVDESFGSTLVSPEFPQFEIDQSVVLPEFMLLACTSEPFMMQVRSRSTGTTAVSRNRLLEADFLSLVLPVPPTDVQQRIVAEMRTSLEVARNLSSSAVNRRRQAWAEFEQRLGYKPPEDVAPSIQPTLSWFSKLDRWDAQQLTDQVTQVSKWPLLHLEDIAHLRLGIQLARQGSKPGPARPYLRAASIQLGTVDLTGVKYMPAAESDVARLALDVGDILFVEGNSQEEVGRSAVWMGGLQGCIYQNSVIRARLDTTLFDSFFVCAWFNSRPGRKYFESNATTTTGTLWHIGKGKLAKAPLPAVPTAMQVEIASHLWQELARADEEMSEAEAIVGDSRAGFERQVFGSPSNR